MAYKSKKGFTLMELSVVVIVIIAVLAISYPIYIRSTLKSRAVEAVNLLEMVQNKQTEYFARVGKYSPNLAALGKITTKTNENFTSDNKGGYKLVVDNYQVVMNPDQDCITAYYRKGGSTFAFSRNYKYGDVGCTGNICKSFGDVVKTAEQACPACRRVPCWPDETFDYEKCLCVKTSGTPDVCTPGATSAEGCPAETLKTCLSDGSGWGPCQCAISAESETGCGRSQIKYCQDATRTWGACVCKNALQAQCLREGGRWSDMPDCTCTTTACVPNSVSSAGCPSETVKICKEDGSGWGPCLCKEGTVQIVSDCIDKETRTCVNGAWGPCRCRDGAVQTVSDCTNDETRTCVNGAWGPCKCIEGSIRYDVTCNLAPTVRVCTNGAWGGCVCNPAHEKACLRIWNSSTCSCDCDPEFKTQCERDGGTWKPAPDCNCLPAEETPCLDDGKIQACLDAGRTWNFTTCKCSCSAQDQAACRASHWTLDEDCKCICNQQLAQPDCAALGGTWDSRTCTCGNCGDKEKSACERGGGIWDDSTCVCYSCRQEDKAACDRKGAGWGFTNDCRCICIIQIAFCDGGGYWDGELCTCVGDINIACDERDRDFCEKGGNMWDSTNCICHIQQKLCDSRDKTNCEKSGGTWDDRECACTMDGNGIGIKP